MSEAATYWFSPAPSEVTSSRLSLDFDLRAADLFFRELVVPELGRIWFARQLSWPLAALALYEELASHGSNAPKPTAICHGIEALACKLEYEANSVRETRSRRILGTRAFGREDGQEMWSFHRLRQASHYVRNTHRQAATRAVRVDGGLGFARGSRFDLLELEPVGLSPRDRRESGRAVPRGAHRARAALSASTRESGAAARAARETPGVLGRNGEAPSDRSLGASVYRPSPKVSGERKMAPRAVGFSNLGGLPKCAISLSPACSSAGAHSGMGIGATSRYTVVITRFV